MANYILLVCNDSCHAAHLEKRSATETRVKRKKNSNEKKKFVLFQMKTLSYYMQSNGILKAMPDAQIA